jgi:hypothetical protein
MVTKIQLAAMGRADVPEDQRRPFYLYVDEFQNFATDSFAVILSEARKYALNLTIANQYISQMSQPVRDAVFGNVGTIVSFRVSPDDSPFLQKYFEPQFEAGDLIQQHNRYFVITMTIDGEKAPAFSAKTLSLPQPPDNSSEQIIELSRERYTQERSVVDALIRQNITRQESGQAAPAEPAVARPKAQAQLNELSKHEHQAAQNRPYHAPHSGLGKVAANLLHSNQPPATAPLSASAKRRRRRKKAGTAPPGQVIKPETTGPPKPADEERVIRLR